MKSKYYQYYQPNKLDLKDNYGDCVIRALTKAMDKEWIEIYDSLIEIARKIQCLPNNKPAYEEYMKQNGFIYTGISNKKGSRRPTVESFTKEHKQGTFVIIAANHIVTCKDGIYYDTWESGDKSMYGYWERKR